MADTVFEAEGKVSLDSSGLESGLSKAVSTVGKAASTMAKAIGAVSLAAAAGVASLVKESVSAYADYEQLVGGIETMFGAGGKSLEEYIESVGAATDEEVAQATAAYNNLMTAQETMLANAANAYSSAGMSANDYMETVTSFSAALVSSLGGDTVAAAEAADQALTDMSDNANKMGTDMESIQSAYQGFAKQNYTMLDNLKLGYGGTESEMERLLEDATEISGIEYDISNLNDVYSAIHVIQTEMGITGTTALEASTTISGSLSSMSAAWENLLVGFSDSDADMETLIGNLVTTATTFAGNVVPVIGQALSGIGSAVEELAPVIADQLPGLINSLIPSLVSGAESLVSAAMSAIGEALPTILGLVPGLISTISEVIQNIIASFEQNGPAILDAVENIIGAIVTALPSLFESIATAIPGAISGIVQAVSSVLPELITALTTALPGVLESIVAAINSNLPTIMAAILSIIETLATQLPNMISAIIAVLPTIFEEIVATLPKLLREIVSALPGIITSLCSSLQEQLPMLIDAIIEVSNMIVESLPEILEILTEALPTVIEAIIDGISENLPMLIDAGMQLVVGLTEGIIENLPAIIEGIIQLVVAVGQALIENLPTIIASLAQVIEQVLSYIWSGLSMILTQIGNWILSLVSAIWGWLQSVWNTIVTWFTTLVTNIVTWLANVWTSISTWFTSVITNISSFCTSIWTTITSAFANVAQIGRDLIVGLWNGINDKVAWIKEKISGFADDVISAIKGFFGIHSPSKVMRDLIGKNLALGIGVGFTTNIDDVKKNMTDALDFGDTTQSITTPEVNAFGSYDLSSSGHSGTDTGDIVGLLSSLNGYMPQLLGGMNQSIVLDTGTLVGQTASAYNNALGTVGRTRARALA